MSYPPHGEPAPSWADLLEAAVSSMRDVRTMLFELNARAAGLTETLDELVTRVIEELAAEIVTEDAIRAAGLDLRLERDPLGPDLELELTHDGGPLTERELAMVKAELARGAGEP